MTIFGFGPDSPWFYILCAVATGGAGIAASVVIGVARVLTMDHRNAKKAPPPSGRGVGPCRHELKERDCQYRITYPFGTDGPEAIVPSSLMFAQENDLGDPDVDEDKCSEGGPGWTPMDMKKFREAELKLHQEQLPDAWPPEDEA
jgi:hypothetical protein